MATYLNPKNDIAFKKLFGDIAHKDIVISFLNSILERKEGRKIIDVTINDPNNLPETNSPEEQSKSSIVDVRCTDQLKNQLTRYLQRQNGSIQTCLRLASIRKAIWSRVTKLKRKSKSQKVSEILLLS